MKQLTNNVVVPPISKFTHHTHSLLYQHYAPKYPLGLLAVPVPTWSTDIVPTTSTDCTNIVTPVSATSTDSIVGATDYANIVTLIFY